MTPVTKLIGILASKSDQLKKRMVDYNVPIKLEKILKNYPNKPELQNNIALAIYELTNEFPDSHSSILKWYKSIISISIY
jgi:hypothetical protein